MANGFFLGGLGEGFLRGSEAASVSRARREQTETAQQELAQKQRAAELNAFNASIDNAIAMIKEAPTPQAGERALAGLMAPSIDFRGRKMSVLDVLGMRGKKLGSNAVEVFEPRARALIASKISPEEKGAAAQAEAAAAGGITEAAGRAVSAETAQGNLAVAQERLGMDKDKAARDAAAPLSPQGKLIADRENFVSQFGEDSPQVKALDEAMAGTEGPSLSDRQGVRKEFTGLSKGFVGVREAFSRVNTAANNPSPAGDLAMIFNFMKMLDPGSVVREGEFATAQNAAGVPTRISNVYNRILSGERLTQEQRQDFLNQAEMMFQKELQFQVRLEDRFKEIAKREGMKTSDFMIDFIGPELRQAAGVPSPFEIPKGLPDGTKQVGTAEDGKRIFQLPNGNKVVEQ